MSTSSAVRLASIVGGVVLAMGIGVLGGITLSDVRSRLPMARHSEPAQPTLVRLREAIRVGLTLGELRQMTIDIRTQGQASPSLVQAAQDAIAIWQETIEGFSCRAAFAGDEPVQDMRGCGTRIYGPASRLGINVDQLPITTSARELRGRALSGLGAQVDAAIAARGR